MDETERVVGLCIGLLVCAILVLVFLWLALQLWKLVLILFVIGLVASLLATPTHQDP